MSDLEHAAIERLQAASEMSLKYYGQPLIITDSGGKDSAVIKELARRSGIGCPMAGKCTRELEFARWPKYKNLYLLAFRNLLADRAARGMYTSWQTPEDVFNWWMEYDVLPGQMDWDEFMEQETI